MVAFNPDIPDVGVSPGQYLNHSKSISQPDANKSVSSLLTGAGQVWDTAIKGIDETNKAVISDVVSGVVDTERDAAIGALESRKVAAANNKVISDANTDVAPDAVDQGIDNVASIQNAQKSGKLAPTYYYQRLTSEVKQLRAQFPGYREYIDQKVSSITGVDPANAYMSHLMQDINKANTGTSELQRTINLVRSHTDNPMMPQIYDNLVKTGDIAAANRAISSFSALTAQRAAAAADRANKKDVREDDGIAATQEATNYGSKFIAQSFQNTSDTAGWKTVQELGDYVQGVRLGTKPTWTAQEADNAYLWLSQQSDTARAHLQKQMYTPGAPNAPTWAARMIAAGKNPNDVIGTAMEPYEMLKKAIRDKDLPLAAQHLSTVQSTLNEGQYTLLTQNTDVKKTLVLTNALNQLGGQNWGQTALVGYLSSSIQPTVQTYLKSQFLQQAIQPDYIRTGDKTQIVPTKNTVSTLQKAGVTDGVVYNKVIEKVDLIGKKDTPVEVKKGLIAANYSTNNADMLGLINDDGINPKTGQTIPGKHSTFARMFSPDNINETFRLTKGTDQWTEVKNTASEMFSLQLFQRDMDDLKQVQKDPNVKIGWDTEKHNWKVLSVSGKSPEVLFAPASRAGANPLSEGFTRASRIMTNLNKGLDVMANIAKAEGSDVDEYLLKEMKGVGLTPDNTIPGQMMRTLLDSRIAPQKPTNGRTEVISPGVGDSVPHFTRETKTPTLEEWIKNPVGDPPGYIKRPEVPSSKKVIGDKEAEALGLYETPKQK